MAKLSQFKKQTGRFFQTLSQCMGRGEITQSSIVVAYYALFSLFPLIIIIGNILPLFHINTAPIAQYLSLILPDRISNFVMPIVDSLLKKHSNGYISFGLIIAAWSVSGLINAIRIGMNRIYGVHQSEIEMSFGYVLVNRILIVVMSSVMIVLFAVIIFGFIFGQQILEFFAPIFKFSMTPIRKIFSYKWPVIILVMFVVILYLNNVLPNLARKKRTILPGVLTTVISWIFLSGVFSLYLHKFNLRWENYGIIGTFIIFMLWLNIGSLLLLFGTCINAALDKMKYGVSYYSRGRLEHFFEKNK